MIERGFAAKFPGMQSGGAENLAIHTNGRARAHIISSLHPAVEPLYAGLPIVVLAQKRLKVAWYQISLLGGA